jgi:hypothetical protein
MKKFDKTAITAEYALGRTFVYVIIASLLYKGLAAAPQLSHLRFFLYAPLTPSNRPPFVPPIRFNLP